ncbi:LLM class flavin-dependent oxidoreductase [Kitasatospora sp. NPDC092948]|uniref:LLM class flavin-dependent oxidoreductase n=1 Tax=Kitasatospora sp. NPDC092948 TaxID=3364088 RepID=UPI0037FA96E3
MGDGDVWACGVRAAGAVEDLGYGTLWFAETTGREAMAQAAILPAATGREAMAQAAILPAATGRITVAAGMADIHARDAVTTGAAHRTLEEAFPGRFVLGLWESHLSLAENVRGHRFDPPPAAMRTHLDMLDGSPFGPPGTAAPQPRLLAAWTGACSRSPPNALGAQPCWACPSSTHERRGRRSAPTHSWP